MSPGAILDTKKKVAQTLIPARSLPKAHSFDTPRNLELDRSLTLPGHAFDRLQVYAPPVAAGSCPMSLASPRTCPFGGACHTCPARVQAKLVVNQPGDRYEQEADRVAETVNRRSDSLVMQRKCTRCNDDPDDDLQMKDAPGPVAGLGVQPEALSTVQAALHSSGEPLDVPTRASMEPRFGQDFSRVRVHTDALAAASAQAINALAYTVGRDIVFGASQYKPSTPSGKRLLAHELAHVVQNNGSDAQIIQRTCAAHSDESYYVRNRNYCRDTPSTGTLHPNHRCYRQIPTGSGCPSGEHVCFRKSDGACDASESHVDSTAPTLSRLADGSCDLSWLGWCSIVHGILDVVGPKVGDFLRLMGPPNTNPDSLEYKMWLRYHRRM